MFDNVGKKLQIVAKVYVWVGIAASVIAGIVVGSQVWNGFWHFLLIAVFGSAGSYLSSLFLYAFGELVENVASIEDDTGYFRKKDMKKEKETTPGA